MTIVCISGYFNPLHVGHIELINRAKQLGDRLIVIVNNDKQAILKKGSTFMKELERCKIVGAIKGVDRVFLSVDDDRSVCESLKWVNPDIFANGGDRLNDEIPESKICRELDIKIMDGLGEKIQSSSNLISGRH